MNKLPVEILEIIFVYSENAKLYRVNSKFYRISKTTITRSKFLWQKYQSQVFVKMFKIKFMKNCNCSKFSAGNCSVQDLQLEIIKELLKFNPGNLDKLMENLGEMKHYKVVGYLLENYSETVQQNLKKISGKNVKLVEILLEKSSFEQEILENLKTRALKKSLRRNSREILEILVPKFTKTRLKDLRKTLNKAYILRFLIGFNRKYDSIIKIILKGIQEEELDARGESLIKSLCEIGCLEGLKEVLKIVNVNTGSGMALFTSITAGNVDLVKYLLSLQDIDTSLFTTYSLLFTLGILIIEIFALLVFSFLVVSWISTLILISSGAISPAVMLELSCIAVPCILGIIVMYNAVPVHNVIYALFLFYRSKSIGLQARVYANV
jgi:hypothetical protein